MNALERPLHVCLLTGGGDAPGLNAAIRGFFHAATRRSIRVSASHFGFEGLLGRDRVAALRIEDVRGILPRGGSILGCSTKSNPFAFANGQKEALEAAATLRRRLAELAIDAVVLAGGDGTMRIASTLSELGMNCIGVPKTIDGDLGGTDQTCGIDTAVETATRAIDALHSTAEAHQRVMVVEVMGRDAGWIALRAGIAGGADAVLIPEIPYEAERVAAKTRERELLGLRFSIVVVGEGARPRTGQTSEVEPAHLGRPPRLGGAGERLAQELARSDLGHDVRVTVLGHLQRGGTPTASDRLLATRLGTHAAELCAERRFGRMVILRGGAIDSLALADVPRAPAAVDPSGELVRCARAIGIELGAE
jgi:ATP-dependent phosphofructokinase / diphosphate-dependent phosphofructokinase